MTLDEATLLAQTLEGLNSIQLIVFITSISQIGLFIVLLIILKSRNTENKLNNEADQNTFTMMSQIYNSFTSTTESFKREQEKDWQRTTQFFKAFNELFRIQKQIYYVIGRLEKRVETIENKLTEDVVNGIK